jgi:hypothetical protein
LEAVVFRLINLLILKEYKKKHVKTISHKILLNLFVQTFKNVKIAHHLKDKNQVILVTVGPKRPTQNGESLNMEKFQVLSK